MPKLFGFFKARPSAPARLVRVNTTGAMSREDLRRKLEAIAERKTRAAGLAHAAETTARGRAKDGQPPSRTGIGFDAPRRAGGGVSAASV